MTARTFEGTREEWLNAIIEEMRQDFRDLGHEIPKVRASVGYTGTADRAGSHILAACWHKECSRDGTREMFFVPELDDSARIIDVAYHELCHAVLPDGEGHKAKTFGRLARALGLEGKLTATYAGEDLRWRAEQIVRKLGEIPHARLNGGHISVPPRRPGDAPEGPSMPRRIPKQGTRNLKVECTGPDCGCVVRMTRKWLEKVGAPTCGCGHAMAEVESPEEES